MDGIHNVHMNIMYASQVGDGSFVYPDDSYFGEIASLVESVEVRFVIGGFIPWSASTTTRISASAIHRSRISTGAVAR